MNRPYKVSIKKHKFLFIPINLPINNHRNKELAILETFLNDFWRCSTLPYTCTPSVVFKKWYKLFEV